MPIDLADYTKPIREALKRGGYACVYVVSADVADPRCRVGYAVDLPATITRLQRSSPAALTLQSALWVPDRGIATVIAKATQCDLNSHKGPGGWYEVDHGKAATAVDLAALRIHPGATMLPHYQIVALRQKRLLSSSA